ncbi:MAG: amidase [Acidobacteriaceae bacterium]|nr:amidase [Acidobacteriaceae bacterium]
MGKLDQAAVPFATITDLNAALRAREVSSLELTKIFGKRLEKLGPDYNALACGLVKQGKRQAKDADSEFKRERFRGPLQGIPYAVKDLIAVTKHPTTWGAKPFADQVFEEDATVVQRLNGQTAVLIGKLSMVELAGGGGYSSAAASLQGPGLNPWNKMYWSGGSSSGSGAAVAAGLVPYALGSETSGSILTPASYCGVSGLRPTYGLVSRHGAMPLSWTLDKIGVLARSADDCGWVLRTIAGRDDNDPASARKSFYYAPQYYERFEDTKVGYAGIDFTEWPDEPLRPAFQNALSVFKSIGGNMVESKLPEFPYGAVIGTIIDSEGASVFEQLIRSGRVDQLADQGQIDGLKASLTYSAVDYLKAMRLRTQIQGAFRDLFADVDLLLSPTHFSPPERADQPFDETEPKRPQQRGVGGGLIPASNLCGLPAITIPCGFVNGLPIGLQIVGGPFSENRILAFAREFQNRTNFHKQHPPGLT